jgi:hypothetical protein
MAKINQKYFGNRNIGTGGEQLTVDDNGNVITPADDKIGGEGIASTSAFTGAGSTGFVTGDDVVFTAPELPGGVTALGKVVATAGALTGITITEKGSGYIAIPSVAFYYSVGTITPRGTIGSRTFTVSLTTDSGAPGSSTNQENAIIAYAKTTSGGTSKPADIIKQRGTKRFKVKTADGTAICTLKSSAVSAVGDMTIIATDSAGGTYYVTKIGAHKCTVTQGTGRQFATDSSVPYTFGAAILNTSLSMANA